MLDEQRLSGETRNDARLDCGDHAEQHTAINVPNFEETIDWYREKLGFEESVRWKAPPHSGEDVQLAFFEFNDARLEVIGGGDPAKLTRPGAYRMRSPPRLQLRLPRGRRRESGRGGADLDGVDRAPGVRRTFKGATDISG
jgi:catechol 2,3-dioxygenase-like lactoylglutathione lyase family enzyme